MSDIADATTERSRAHFGAGGGEPYARGLRESVGPLILHRLGSGHPSTSVDLPRFLAPADRVDRELAAGLVGPVLDIGCGPGRMVAAVLSAGQPALGIDVSAAAVAVARSRGLPVLRRSVFDRMPHGHWRAALLLDGNIGIGGSPGALLARAAELVQRGSRGRVVVEAHPESGRDHTFDAVVIDAGGGASMPFPWAEVGLDALRSHASAAALMPVREWTSGDRTFAEFARP